MRKVFFKGVPVLLFTTLTVTACSFGSDEAMKEMDTPPVSYVEEGDSLDIEELGEEISEENAQDEGEVDEEAVKDKVERELYLIDSNGLVVPQTLALPKTEGTLRQSLEYLVQDGPVSDMLPNGFQAVIPAGTTVDVNLKDGTAIADFSKEFKEYNPEQEQQILQAITWTLTQFDNVEQVQIRINGHNQETMPVNGTPIGKGVSRANGINIEADNVVDVVNSKGVNLYFLAQNGDNTYYVPVTRRVSNETDTVKVAVEELLKGPSYHSNLLTEFSKGVALIDEPMYENGVVTLNFNEALLNQLQGSAVSQEVMNMLALTLTEQEGIEKVAVQVNGEGNILSESGEVAEPVSRPTKINKGSF
ncbi:GerMN domain-containing protein [Halalkalibacter urbisdiaboli]|uniref:GerMN domain-containing protein n=1 Tax=Halalkalibacter urbisdiaboli TaxID=1960589 RepID=UPI000B43A4A2|nr:GerMN domain-containing protein [Halalkalibacter urbisdiaboli]